MIWPYVSLAVGIALAAGGQISLKEGVLRSPSLGVNISVLFNPFVLAGLLAYLAGALFYIHAIKQIPLSVAFPAVSVSYIVVAIFAHWIWGEPFGAAHFIALALIGAGVYILSRQV
jgi:undecaprenyl phosphate-alpha-L-ara4N flippase subunit ArnE